MFRQLMRVLTPAPQPAPEPEADPLAALDGIVDRQIDVLRDLRRSLVEATASKRRLEVEAMSLRERAASIDLTAREAAGAGNDERARSLLAEQLRLARSADAMELQANTLSADVARIANTERRIQDKLAALRTERDILRARADAAGASMRASSVAESMGEELADADYTLRQAKKHVATASARAELAATPNEAAWFDDQVERLNDEVANREGNSR